jgi:hypothetical protein
MTGFTHRAVTASPQGQPAERERQAPEHPHTHLLNKQPEHPQREPAGRTSIRLVSPAGKLSHASQEASTTRPTRGSPTVISSWTSAPPVSLPC